MSKGACIKARGCQNSHVRDLRMRFGVLYLVIPLDSDNERPNEVEGSRDRERE